MLEGIQKAMITLVVVVVLVFVGLTMIVSSFLYKDAIKFYEHTESVLEACEVIITAKVKGE